MKRHTGYFATQRRHHRARALESATRRAARVAPMPRHRRRFAPQVHHVGGNAGDTRLVVGLLALASGIALIAGWLRRR